LRSGLVHQDVALRGPARDRQYAQAGIFISSHCHVLLALWDGLESDRLGGTAQIVRFHLHGELPGAIERRRGTTLALLRTGRGTVVFHLPTRRNGDDEMASTQGRGSRPTKPQRSPTCLKRSTGCSGARRSSMPTAASTPARSPRKRVVLANQPCPIHAMFITADWLARTYQRRVNRVLRIVYLLAAAMGFAFFLYTHVSTHQLIINLFLVFFLAGMGVVLVSRRREWQRKYLDYRALAEGLRVQSYWRRAASPTCIRRPSRTTTSCTTGRGTGLDPQRDAQRQPGRPAGTDGGAGSGAVVREWIGTTESGGQLRYFSVAAARRAGCTIGRNWRACGACGSASASARSWRSSRAGSTRSSSTSWFRRWASCRWRRPCTRPTPTRRPTRN
jgi:hypothetical protein